MAKKTSAASRKHAKKRAAPKSPARTASMSMPKMPSFDDMQKMTKLMTPQQAIELYKANAKLALDVINAAIEGTARLRKRQYEAEEDAAEFQKKHAKSAAEANNPQALMAVGQGAAQEAMEKSMHYWGEMFDLIVEIQKRLFTLLEDQAQGVPGVKEAKAAFAMLPDLGQMQKVVSAMQNVVASGAPAFDSMQRVMGDFTRLAQNSMPGMRR